MRQGGAAGAHDAEDVDVEDLVPLFVGVVLDGADGSDAGVVDEDVQTAELFDGVAHGCPYGGVVRDVGRETEQRCGELARVEVEHGDRRAAFRQCAGRGEPDAGGAAGDDGSESREIGHAVPPCAARSATQNVPSG